MEDMVTLERRIMDLVGRALARGVGVMNGPAWERAGFVGPRPNVHVEHGRACLIGVLSDELGGEDMGIGPHRNVAVHLDLDLEDVEDLEQGFEDWTGHDSEFTRLGARIRDHLGLNAWDD